MDITRKIHSVLTKALFKKLRVKQYYVENNDTTIYIYKSKYSYCIVRTYRLYNDNCTILKVGLSFKDEMTDDFSECEVIISKFIFANEKTEMDVSFVDYTGSGKYLSLIQKIKDNLKWNTDYNGQ